MGTLTQRMLVAHFLQAGMLLGEHGVILRKLTFAASKQHQAGNPSACVLLVVCQRFLSPP